MRIYIYEAQSPLHTHVIMAMVANPAFEKGGGRLCGSETFKLTNFGSSFFFFFLGGGGGGGGVSSKSDTAGHYNSNSHAALDSDRGGGVMSWL